MQKESVVTIICLCYNHGRFVRQALDSIHSQSYPFVELIIVDDHSTDDSCEQIREWMSENGKVTFVENQNNMGNTSAFNKGLALSQGNYVMDFAADDVLLPDCIEKLVQRFKQSEFENTGVVYCNAQLITENGQAGGSAFFPTDSAGYTINPIPTGNIYRSVVDSGNKICPIAMLVHRKVWNQLESYDESLAYEDLDFWIRSAREFDYDYVDEVLCQKRVVSDSLSKQYKKRLNKRAVAVNNSTYRILKNTFENLNRTSAEDQALTNRIHYELSIAVKSLNFLLALKYVALRIKMGLTNRAS